MSMQIANRKHPNSLSNTIPICVFQEKDSPLNLQTDGAGSIQSSADGAQQSAVAREGYQSFSVRGQFDYELQTTNYGFSGSSGVRPCLHCHCTKKDMSLHADKHTDGHSQPKSLQYLADDYQRYVESGAHLPHAKAYNNAIRPISLLIPIKKCHHSCPPHRPKSVFMAI